MAKLNFSDFTLRFRRGTTANVNAAATYAQQGEPGYTIDDKTLYVSDGTSYRQVVSTMTVVSKSTTYSAVLSDSIVQCNTTGGAFTVTIPAASGNKGQVFRIKDSGGAGAANNITIATSGGNIDGAATATISTNYGKLTVYSDGSNWYSI